MRSLAVLALACAAIASPNLDNRQPITWNTNSIYSVLVTALPGSLLAEATNTAKLSSDLAAAFSTGTPGWFSSLPADVKSWIVIQGEAGAPAPTGAAPSAGHSTALKNSSGIASPTLTATATLTSSSSSSGSPHSSTSASSSSSTGGATMPTAVLGGALVGLIGALVL